MAWGMDFSCKIKILNVQCSSFRIHSFVILNKNISFFNFICQICSTFWPLCCTVTSRILRKDKLIGLINYLVLRTSWLIWWYIIQLILQRLPIRNMIGGWLHQLVLYAEQVLLHLVNLLDGCQIAYLLECFPLVALNADGSEFVVFHSILWREVLVWLILLLLVWFDTMDMIVDDLL